jgi:hypothetical protein
MFVAVILTSCVMVLSTKAHGGSVQLDVSPRQRNAG